MQDTELLEQEKRVLTLRADPRFRDAIVRNPVPMQESKYNEKSALVVPANNTRIMANYITADKITMNPWWQDCYYFGVRILDITHDVRCDEVVIRTEKGTYKIDYRRFYDETADLILRAKPQAPTKTKAGWK